MSPPDEAWLKMPISVSGTEVTPVRNPAKVATSVERTVDVSEVLGNAGAVESHQSTISESDVAPTEILLEPGELPRIVDLGEQALLVRAQHLYIRGGRIVRTVKVPTAITSGKQANITQVKPIAKHALAEELTKVATWVKVDKRRREGDERVVINCPLQVAETLMARDQWSLRSLTAIIHGPTLRADGSILEMAGYDDATGLLLEPHTSFAPVPQRPSWEDGLAALARLDKIVSKFPFVSEADKAVWFAGLLTAAIRRSLPTSPMFAFTAPTAGTGKSYMADLIATIVKMRAPGMTWMKMPVFTWTALCTNILIVATGGAVRLTASGLGCPTWPLCTEDSL